VTDAEWAILEPFVPPACSCGRKRTQSMRERFFVWINDNRPGHGLRGGHRLR
jgi:hypothetical protein